MRMLKIETFAYDSGNLVDSVSIPSPLVRSLSKFILIHLAERFSANGMPIDALVEVIDDLSFSGVILDVTDAADNERVVFSVA